MCQLRQIIESREGKHIIDISKAHVEPAAWYIKVNHCIVVEGVGVAKGGAEDMCALINLFKIIKKTRKI